MNKPNQKLTTSIVITNVTNIHIKLFAEDIQQLKRGKITKRKKIVGIRSAVKGIRKKLRMKNTWAREDMKFLFECLTR